MKSDIPEQPSQLQSVLELLEAFSEHLAGEGLSPETRRGYLIDVRALGDRPVQEITQRQLEELKSHLILHRQMDPRSVRRKISAWRRFFAFAVDLGVIDTNPATNLKRPRVPRREPRYLTEEQVARMLGSIHVRSSRRKPSMMGLRDRAILLLLATFGLRRREVCLLHLWDYDRTRRTLHVTGKGSRERTIPINDECQEALEAWLDVRPDVSHDRLFTSRTGTAPRGSTIAGLVKRIAAVAGLDPDQIHPHMLRHSAATRLKKHMTLDEVQRILGHADIRTTLIYLHLDQEDVRAAVVALPRLDVDAA